MSKNIGNVGYEVLPPIENIMRFLFLANFKKMFSLNLLGYEEKLSCLSLNAFRGPGVASWRAKTLFQEM